ncbi:flagellar basal body-associated protein FliL [Vibrio sp. 10N.286.49.B3]|uniref:flagellar basal body-associated protein FliL n=1 Tax=Vibrio sp. 10N.286.49.B3 TaxID=1880855 RepID=UPI000C85BD81|nr:flagellar basal body-associated protein FliL [Vibrio sp. 10N.286.49.B3]PMH41035.1 flagellar basal body-associated protein FliL [Vibrio sp. 10N.286.49.B3]
MADEQEGNASKKKLLMIIAVIAVLLISGAVAFFVLNSSDNNKVGDDKSTQVVSPKNRIQYVNIPQPFLFNVTGDQRDRLVQIKVQVMVRGESNENLARHHSPLIESALLSTFASVTVEQLRSPDGRAELRDKATEDIQAQLVIAIGQSVIDKVLFTDFVIQ